jgi:hypothetical protein
LNERDLVFKRETTTDEDLEASNSLLDDSEMALGEGFALVYLNMLKNIV